VPIGGNIKVDPFDLRPIHNIKHVANNYAKN
jgi:hypothetical protein